MLPRRHRISRQVFPHAARGERSLGQHFSVTVRTLPGPGRAAVVISKKVARRAVDRHLLKRRIMAALRPWCLPGYAIIVYARAGSAALPYRALSEELSALLGKLIVR